MDFNEAGILRDARLSLSFGGSLSKSGGKGPAGKVSIARYCEDNSKEVDYSCNTIMPSQAGSVNAPFPKSLLQLTFGSFKSKAVCTRKSLSFAYFDDSAQDNDAFGSSIGVCLHNGSLSSEELANSAFNRVTMNTDSSTDSADSGFSDSILTKHKYKRRKLNFDSEDLSKSSSILVQQPSENVTDKNIKLSTDSPRNYVKSVNSDQTMIFDYEEDTCERSLVGDRSSLHSLPSRALSKGRHYNLQAITPATMSALLRGDFPDVDASIVDCRYPYEYKGGHIKGAENLFTKDQVVERFLSGKATTCTSADDTSKKHVIIFHCEFSSERGPKMLNFLREQDRRVNEYPALHYPEVYTLDGGYKAFWEYCNKVGETTFCVPRGYTPMLDDCHVEELKFFRRKSSSKLGSRQ